MPRPLYLLGRAQPGWRGGAVTFSPASHASLTLALRGKREPRTFRRPGKNGERRPSRIRFAPFRSDRFHSKTGRSEFRAPAGPDQFRWPQGAVGEGSVQALGSFPNDLAERFRSLLADSCVIHHRHGIRQRIERNHRGAPEPTSPPTIRGLPSGFTGYPRRCQACRPPARGRTLRMPR